VLFRWCTDRAIGDDIVTDASSSDVETSPATAITAASIPAENALFLYRFMNTSLSRYYVLPSAFRRLVYGLWSKVFPSAFSPVFLSISANESGDANGRRLGCFYS